MKDHKGDYRGFVHLAEAYYGKTLLANRTDRVVDEICFGFYSHEGGTSGEMVMEWVRIDPTHNYVATPHLSVFNDAFHAMNQCADVMKMLADIDAENYKMPPKHFCQILLECGFKDRTDRTERDNHHKQAAIDRFRKLITDTEAKIKTLEHQ